eukprot:GILK01003890.1.p1 GENE.GILK01003890.1~~GILK01003890.1.p1  ORF type:complete len:372 (-),score=71.69 GILK01003890.1:117-1232(-)
MEPPTIPTSQHVFDVRFHPTEDVIAAGFIDGEIQLYHYTAQENKCILKLNHHAESCRSLQFSPDGNFLFSASSDKSMAAVDRAGKIAWHNVGAHDSPINSMLCVDEHTIVSGDDDGVIKVWDMRQGGNCAIEFHEHADYISDMTIHDDKKTLLATAGDGCLGVYDIRKPKGNLDAMSDAMEEELLCVQIVKNGRKVVCGTSEGVVDIFSWGWWGDITDRMVGHPQSVDTMIAIDPDTVITGSSDGMLRAVSILPNKILSVIGQHSSGDEDFDIERIALSRDGQLIASCSHDMTVKFWNISYLYGRAKEEEPAEPEQPIQRPRRTDADMEEDEPMESDDSDESDEDDEPKPRGRSNKSAAPANRNAGFFSGL